MTTLDLASLAREIAFKIDALVVKAQNKDFGAVNAQELFAIIEAGLSSALKAQQEQLPVGMKFAATVALSQRITELEADVLALTTALAEAKQEADIFRAKLIETRWGSAEQWRAAQGRIDDIERQYGIRLVAIERAEHAEADLAALRLQLRAYREAKLDFDAKRLNEDHHEWGERHRRLVAAEESLLTAFLASLTPQEQR